MIRANQQSLSGEQEALIESLTATLLNPRDQPLAIRPSKEKILSQDWNISSVTGPCLRIPVINLECATVGNCARDLHEFIKDIKSSRIKNESYECPICCNMRSMKKLRFDFVTLSFASKAKHALFESLMAEKKPRTSDAINEIQDDAKNYIRDVQVNVKKNGSVQILKDGRVLKEYYIPMDCLDPNYNPKSELDHNQITDFINTSDKMIAITNKAKHTSSVLQEIFGSFTQSTEDPNLEKDAFSAFEDSFNITNERYTALTDMTFSVPRGRAFETYGNSLQLYYPAMRKKYPQVELFHRNQPFNIPSASRLSSFIDPVSGKAGIIVTGGFRSDKELSNDVYEIEFNVLQDMEIREGKVTQVTSMRKARAYHSICWNPHMKQVIVVGGLTPSKDSTSREPTNTLELGAKENVQGKWKWVWYHLKELKTLRLFASVCTTERYLFVFGGFIKDGSTGYRNIDSGTNMIEIKEIERFDFKTNKSSIICKISDSVAIYHQATCFSNKANGIIIFGGNYIGKRNNPKERSVLFYDTETNNYRELCLLSSGIDTPYDSHYRYVTYLQNVELLVTSGLGQNLTVLKYDLSRDTIEYAKC